MLSKKLILIILILALKGILFAQTGQESQVKNVILLIPDGASYNLVTLARWYKGEPLAVDKIISGMVKTHCSDKRFPDSAPTSSAYATGVKTKAPYIGVDSMAMPQMSVLELARLKGLSTGVVVTCEFPHATPADFVCHFDNRDGRGYSNLSRQFVYNSPSLVFAGGEEYLQLNKISGELKNKGFSLVTDMTGFNGIANDSVWALFADYKGNNRYKSYECDRNKNNEPGLSEMTRKAIQILSKNPRGFFLMVEGSQIDWACHNNDPYAAVTEFIEFDNAVREALDFAASDGHTLVIVCPDHGNGGISLGNKKSNTSFLIKNPNRYDEINIEDSIINPLKMPGLNKMSARKLSELIITNPEYAKPDSVKKFYNLNDREIYRKINNIGALYPRGRLSDTIQYILGSSFSEKNYIGWTTSGHTAEDVFLGIFAPPGAHKLGGVTDNSDIGKYIATSLQLGSLKDSTEKYYCHYKELFQINEIKCINKDSMVVSKNGNTIVLYANTNKVKTIQKSMSEFIYLTTIIVAIPKMDQTEYYLPRIILSYLK